MGTRTEDGANHPLYHGAFDGEGCVHISRRSDLAQPRLRLDLSQKDVFPLERFRAAVGNIGNIVHKKGDVHSWTVQGAPAHAVMELLRPYLGEESRKTRKYQEALDEGCRPEKLNGWATGERSRRSRG